MPVIPKELKQDVVNMLIDLRDRMWAIRYESDDVDKQIQFLRNDPDSSLTVRLLNDKYNELEDEYIKEERIFHSLVYDLIHQCSDIELEMYSARFKSGVKYDD